MINRTLITNSIIAIVILLALWFGYKMFFGGASAPAETTTPGLVAAGYLSGDQQQTTDEFLSILQDLQGVKLNGELFGTDFFRSLNDVTTVLPVETPGRPNPFAPLGVNVMASTSASSSARDQLIRSGL